MKKTGTRMYCKYTAIVILFCLTFSLLPSASAAECDCNLYEKNPGFFTLNIGEEEIYDDNSSFNVIYEKSPRVTIGDGLYRQILPSIFGADSSEPYLFYTGYMEKDSYVIYKTKGIITDFQIDTFTSGERADKNSVHEIYLSEDGKNYVKLDEGADYFGEEMRVENNGCEWYDYYTMKRLKMNRSDNPYKYKWLKIVFPDVDTEARYASMLGDVHIWTINTDLPSAAVSDFDNKSADNTINVSFSKQMDEQTIKAENFELENYSVISAKYSQKDKSAALVLDRNLAENADYVLNISGNVKSISGECIENRQIPFETKSESRVFYDDNSNLNVSADRSANVTVSDMFGAGSSEPYVYRTNGKGIGNYITYKTDGVLTGFKFKTYSSSDRIDKENYPAVHDFTIYLSEDGVNFDRLTLGREYETSTGAFVENNECEWFNYYEPREYKSREIPLKYKYIKILFPDTDVDFSEQMGDAELYYTDSPCASFGGFLGDNAVRILFSEEINTNTAAADHFSASGGVNIADITFQSDKKTAVAVFDKSVTDCGAYSVNIGKSVTAKNGSRLFKDSRTINFRTESSVVGEEKNNWVSARFGGGGMVTGIVCHPAEKDLVYVRTDVGGAYRFDGTKKEWIALNDSFGEKDKNLLGISGIAIDPQNPDVVYLAAGEYWYMKDYGSDVLKSYDRGRTWEKTGLNVAFDANNGEGRRRGECIAVDPNNSGVIYCGTRFNGLAASDDGAKSWYYIPDVESAISYPGQNTSQGIRVVAFDDESGVADGRTKTVYVASDELGVYKTNDGGRSWSIIDDSPKSVLRMECIGGALYMAAKTGIFKYDGFKTTDITPENAAGRKAETVCTAYTSDKKPVIIATCEGDYPEFYVYRKIGDGDWELCSSEINSNNIITNEMTWDEIGINFCATAIDPHPDNEGEILMWGLDGRGIWKSTDMLSNDIKYSFDVKGIEETCVNNVVSVPGDNPYVAVMDYAGWKMSNPHGYDNYHFFSVPSALTDHVNGEYLGQITGFDFCEENPKFIAMSADCVNYGFVCVSEDGGESFKNNGFPTTEGAGMGDVAVSSQIKDKKYPVIVACARRNEKSRDVYALWSDDWGRTWHRCEGLPPNLYDASQYDQSRNIIEPDRVRANVFYAIDKANGDIYVSEDWGESFKKSRSAVKFTDKGDYCSVVSNPKKANEVYVVINKSLYKTNDGFENITKLTEFDNVSDFSYGKGKGEDMSLYVLGNIKGRHGLYRSDDAGASWLKLNGKEYGLANANRVEGDRNVYAKAYVGTSGRGVFVCGGPDAEYRLISSGGECGSIPSGDFSAEAVIQKETDTSARLAAALYKNNRLVNVYLSEEKKALRGEKFKAEISAKQEFDTLKCFLWDFKSIMPISDYAEFKK